MSGRAGRLLLVTFLLLLPITALLVIDHVRHHRRLRAGAEGRTSRRAKNVAIGLAARIDEIQERLQGVVGEGPFDLGAVEETVRSRFAGGADLVVSTGDAPRPRLDRDTVHGLVAVPRVDLGRGRSLSVRVPLDLRPPAPEATCVLLVTDQAGRPLWRLPAEEPRPLSDQDRTKRSSFATRRIHDGDADGFERYRDMNDEDVLGAWATVPGAGGVVAEESVADALEPVSGAQTWHFAAGLLALMGIPLLLLEIARRWSAAQALLRLYGYARRYWKLIGVVILCMGVYAAGTGAQLFMIKLLVEDVLLSRAPDAAWRVLILLSVAMGVVVLLMAGARFFRSYVSARVQQSVVNDVRCAVGSHLLALSLRFHLKRRQGELLSRLTNDVGQSRRALGLIFGDVIQQPLLLVAAVAAGFATNWRLAAMIFFAFPILVYPIARFGRRIKRHAEKRQVKRADVTNVMMQMLSGFRIVKAFRMEPHETRRLRKASDALLHRSMKVARTTALSETVLELFNALGATAILLVGGYFVLYGRFGITVADLVTFSAILGRMYKPVKDITKTYNKIQNTLPSIHRVLEILDQRPDIVDRPDAKRLEVPRRTVAFEDVTFAYETQPVLRDITFEVPVGSVVALVGPTGAGKSTLTDLVARFYDPTEGRILIDGVDLRDYAVDSLLSRVAVVTQESFLFHSTIRDNILYGRPDATPGEVEAAARAAFIHEEILAQSEGYDTIVGDRGTRLSGGQRQRITIARAILKDADILILDEATSSLDSRSEGEVQDALSNLMQGRTTFVVAHRLSTIRNADRILVLDGGRIVETGSHEELLERRGLYQTLHAMQKTAPGD